MACIHYASKIQELKINGEIISSHLHPLHLQRMPTEQVLFSFKKVSNIWENCTEKQCPMLSGDGLLYSELNKDC